ncbi:Glycosyl transferases group 1 [Marinitoga hydrogenitolerans DSM 16785]|uniref:Glycosyl transferases group 1 n=1 Tax=Marinitoga hydrogenitolerans (strain DSM 16785 / JCM 12826 / AT1271) TaxID=1122195 RepID=A0A1M4Y4E6_MARH1|nr:glycosyltransferase [Marinitoga hydrogenitolerans]SHF00486.1 Glycosyl transferases group 1 [Marinitoga hydrogenitolerans DSM 16785]
MKNVLIIGYMEFQPNMQRGISLITEAFAENEYNVVYLSFPTYFPHLIIKSKRNLLKGTIHKYNKSIVSNKTVLCKVPYFFNKKYIKWSFLFPVYEKSHAKPLLNFIKKNKFDIIVIESGKAVFLAKYLKDIKSTKIIYRQSDPVEFILDGKLKKYEHKLIEHADLTLVANKKIFNEYEKKYPKLTDKMEIFENGFVVPDENTYYKNPYKTKNNFIYFGLFELDWNYIITLAKSIPEVNIHIFGPYKNKKIKKFKNIHLYGFMSHNKILPYVKYSDTCLLPYKNDKEKLKFVGITSKILTYMYFEKIIISTPYEGSELLKEFGILIPENLDDFIKISKKIINSKNLKIKYDINFEKYKTSTKKEEFINIIKNYKII